MAKIEPWWLARRDSFLAKAPVPIAISDFLLDIHFSKNLI
jgi:hypothetical protein